MAQTIEIVRVLATIVLHSFRQGFTELNSKSIQQCKPRPPTNSAILSNFAIFAFRSGVGRCFFYRGALKLIY